jgi:hypothetical protein
MVTTSSQAQPGGRTALGGIFGRDAWQPVGMCTGSHDESTYIPRTFEAAAHLVAECIHCEMSDASIEVKAFQWTRSAGNSCAQRYEYTTSSI